MKKVLIVFSLVFFVLVGWNGVCTDYELVIGSIIGTGILRIEIVTTLFSGNEGQYVGVSWVME